MWEKCVILRNIANVSALRWEVEAMLAIVPDSVTQFDSGLFEWEKPSYRLQGQAFARARWPKQDSQPRRHSESNIQGKTGQFLAYGHRQNFTCSARRIDR